MSYVVLCTLSDGRKVPTIVQGLDGQFSTAEHARKAIEDMSYCLDPVSEYGVAKVVYEPVPRPVPTEMQAVADALNAAERAKLHPAAHRSHSGSIINFPNHGRVVFDFTACVWEVKSV